MRHVLIAAAAFAASGFLASAAANAQPFHAGGPVQIGNMCRVNTDTADGGEQLDRYGYYESCANQVAGVPYRGAGAATSALAAAPDYYNGSYAYAAAPAYDSAVAYCIGRFKSYDPARGTYLGYDGKRHRCP